MREAFLAKRPDVPQRLAELAGPSSTNSNFNDARAAGASGKSSYYATAFSDVIEHSGVPRGSTYYHFPGGKRDLAREAIAAAGDEREEMVAKAAERANYPASLVRALGEVEAQRLDHSAYQRGCAIATMVLELAPDDEELSTDFDNAFARWRAALVARFEPWGYRPQARRGPRRSGHVGDRGLATARPRRLEH